MSDYTAAGEAPIVDVTYRSYDGPLVTRAVRWWVVTLAMLRILVRRPGFWILVGLALLPYVVGGMVFYFQSIGTGLERLIPPYPPGQKFAAEFWTALERQQLWLFLIALLIGSGSIAADNRSNALLVYLSKPLTKGDYLLGKWMGVFIPVFLAAAAPGLVLYLYGAMSFRNMGFVSDEPWLCFRMLGAATIPAAMHASLLLGFSSWSKTPRIAGASYAGLYFVSGMISSIVGLIVYRGDAGEGILVGHMSVGGVISGMTQHLYGISQLIQTLHRERGGEMLSLDPPILWINLVALAGLIVLGVTLARARIKAVEVIQG